MSRDEKTRGKKNAKYCELAAIAGSRKHPDLNLNGPEWTQTDLTGIPLSQTGIAVTPGHPSNGHSCSPGRRASVDSASVYPTTVHQQCINSAGRHEEHLTKEYKCDAEAD
eukprot:919412-Pelagomonas_calceolata.AAC.7